MAGTVAVIGTAGRKDDAARINRRLYDAMYAETLDAVSKWELEAAVSGGAAVADHLAVRAYLEGQVGRLTLFLPARFERGRFVPNPAVRSNPGATTNRYHEAFSDICGVDSLAEIAKAIEKGATAVVREGFHLRNSEVAEACTHMLAFTFGSRSSGDVGPGYEAFSGHCAAVLEGDDTTSHESVPEAENQRKRYQDFLPGDPGFTDAKVAGLRDGGTAHTWNQAWKPKFKRHVRLGLLPRLA